MGQITACELLELSLDSFMVVRDYSCVKSYNRQVSGRMDVFLCLHALELRYIKDCLGV